MQWIRNDNLFLGVMVQTGSSITLGQGDVGETITVTASYTDTLGTEESVASSATQQLRTLMMIQQEV